MMTRRRGHGAARWLVGIVIVAAIGLGLFFYRHQQASAAIKAEALGIVAEFDLRPEWEAQARAYVNQAHEKAFNAALDIAGQHGRKFDADTYLEVLFDQVIAWAREDGEDGLADYLSDNRATFSLDVSER